MVGVQLKGTEVVRNMCISYPLKSQLLLKLKHKVKPRKMYIPTNLNCCS